MKDISQRLVIRILLFSTFVVSICGLSYELLIGSLSTNLEGNPVLQYSITIGFFMSAMGVGSYLSRFFSQRLLYQFIVIEIVLGILGGISVAILNLVFIKLYPVYQLFSILFLMVVGILVGLEIPLITRILKQYGDLKETISNVLTIDYIGGLAASLIFPLILYPFVGLIKTAFIIGFLNVLIGVINLKIFSNELQKGESIKMWMISSVCLVLLGCGIGFSGELTGFYSKAIYGNVLYNRNTRYQNIVISLLKGETQLFIDGHLQFSSGYEYRYHEALVYPPFYLRKNNQYILVMGGGDGLAVREILKFKSVKKIVLVDLDRSMTQLAKNFSILNRLNENAFNHPKVEIINQDAYKYLGTTPYQFDVIYADFPDPHDATLSKLYSVEFYHFVKRRLKKDGIFITQATSPLHAKYVFRCIEKTLKMVFRSVIPYHVNVPSMSDWGFHIAHQNSINIKKNVMNVPVMTRYFTLEIFKKSLIFAKDTKVSQDKIKANYFTEPIIYRYYLDSWRFIF